MILPVSRGLRLIPDGSICPVSVHCGGAKRKVQGGERHEGDWWWIICNKLTYCKELRLFVSLLLILVPLDECSVQPDGTTVGDSGEQLYIGSFEGDQGLRPLGVCDQ